MDREQVLWPEANDGISSWALVIRSLDVVLSTIVEEYEGWAR